MFSYLRPGHAKRSASSLASPEPPSPVAYPLPSPSQTTEYGGSPRFSDHASHVSNSPISPFPPQLPPISRVASKLEKPSSAGRPAPSPSSVPPPTSPPLMGARGPNMPAEPAYAPFSKSQPSLTTGRGEKQSSSSRSPAIPLAAVPAKGKSRLNLRNPMSLLMRRRSGQTLDPLADESLVSHRAPALVPPMPANYDPSIRGHIVHDFNAPRLNRNFSYTSAYANDHVHQEAGRLSPQKIEREHTPVFHEHFDDDTSYRDSQAAIRAEQLANNDFLARNSLQLPPPRTSPPPPPPLPKDSSPTLSPSTWSPPPPSRPSLSAAENASTILSPVLESPDPMDVSTDTTPRKPKPPKSPPPTRSRATSMTDPAFQSAGLPSHFTSRASRFSFQISGGSDSAQEAILEERHKQKAAEKASKQTRMSTNTIDDEYDDYGMDDYDDMDGGFEEEIPMLGEEDDFSGLGHQTMVAGISNFDFSSLSMYPNTASAISPIIPSDQFSTPVDASGNRIGYALSEETIQLQHAPTEVDLTVPVSAWNQNQDAVQNDLDDDMYFDDGLIGLQDEDVNAATEFDENVFDDPDGPLFDRKMKLPQVEELPTSSTTKTLAQAESGVDLVGERETSGVFVDATAPSLAHKTSVVQQGPVPDSNNMNAYHSALADAATRAEAAGRFTRKASNETGRRSPEAENVSTLSDSRPSLVPDDGRFSLETDGFTQDDDILGMSSAFVDDYDYSDYDSTLEDDPMIAAANAEALAFDDEGFYGQEFGFYASAVGDSPNAWGGFFGPSGLGRTVSGRNAVREPNLTPITERSEYSTRNSFISLNHFRDGQQPLSSPGLAQLARMSPYEWPEEEDMSLDTLLKLRKGAFGGSTISLPNSTANSPRNSSPMGMQFVPRLSSAAGNRMVEHTDSELESDESPHVEGEGDDEHGEALRDVVNANHEEENDSGGDPKDGRFERPTQTASHYNLPLNHEVNQVKDLPPLPSSAQLQALHNSVTYVRDHDEAGEGRWILERRRTAESGELELIGREIVEGGRI
ncbi:hypothetical protein DE146DRAFT_615005 [Phaeosphaeria sp. MPI-PUGE-AT-0046c]|nr:hypothetical protein DE146DRAFT_615005 [Phaeosphaeria sp. MPI-PUGE-AT-0046c]